jgi:hypothetical protein
MRGALLCASTGTGSQMSGDSASTLRLTPSRSHGSASATANASVFPLATVLLVL